jgi:hypothetical protein
MSFIQTELDHSAFVRPTVLPGRETRQAPTLDIAFSCDERPLAIAAAPGRLQERVDEIVACGLPGSAIPLALTLTTGTFPVWLSAAVVFATAAIIVKRRTTQYTGANWRSAAGFAVLGLALFALAADHAAALIVYAGAAPGAYLATALTTALTATFAAAGWLIARKGLVPATRDLLVPQGLTLALTLIVLANRAALGGAALATYHGTATLGLIAVDVGLGTLGPILSAGIAFSFFIAGLRCCKALTGAQNAAAATRRLAPGR